MDAALPPVPRTKRPHRVVINVDDETRDTLRAMAYASGLSVSNVAADALRMLLPAMGPVVEVIREARTRPAEAMAKLAVQAETIAALADQTVREVREAAAESVRQGGSPPVK